jgi:hypothetical protein
MTLFLCVHGEAPELCELCDPESDALAKAREARRAGASFNEAANVFVARLKERKAEDARNAMNGPPPARRKTPLTLAEQERQWIRDNGWSGKQ